MRSLLLTLLTMFILGSAPSPVRAQAPTETLTVIDTGCVTGNTCTLQLSREALAPGVSTCDAAGNSKYSAISTASVVPVIGSVNTAWTYADTAITQGVSYCYVATVTSQAGLTSPASAPFLAAIPAAPAPPAPTVTGNYVA